jgi:hypothetical protein
MVGAVSALRTFSTLGVGLIAGGVIGAYAMTVVYGPHAPIEPTKLQCPPCPACAVASAAACPVCPGPDDDTAPGASASPSPADTVTAATPETLDIPTEPRLPGLPASALRLASAGFTREIAPCLEKARADGLRGTVLLDLTVTSTGSVGHIPAVELVRADATAADVGPCLVEAARRVHFEWRDEDGQTRLRFPVALTDPSP